MIVGGGTAIGCGTSDPGTDSGPRPDSGGGGTDSGSGGADSGGGGACATVTSTIGANHGHVLMVSAADVAAGTERTYMIQGTSTHPHDVVVTSAQFAQLAAGTTVMAVSSLSAAHMHAITIMCAPA